MLSQTSLKITSAAIAVVSMLASSGCATDVPAVEPRASSCHIPDCSVFKIADAVALWQLSHLGDLNYVVRYREDSEKSKGWVQGTFYLGLLRWAAASNNSDFLDSVRTWAYGNEWGLGERIFHADDHVVGQAYLELVRLGAADAEVLTEVRANAKVISRAKFDLPLIFDNVDTSAHDTRLCQVRWCWADALFMSPPTWFQLAMVDNNTELRNFAHREFWATTEYLFSEEHGLYFRDSRFFDNVGDYGEPVFWSRGNGWVLAGLVHILDALPPDDPYRKRYEKLFVKMADAVVDIQRSDGFWHASLLGPEDVMGPESSGTAFFVYALSEGLRRGLIEGVRYEDAVGSGWDALVSVVDRDGKLGYVQQIGDAPDEVASDSTQFYGNGAFLLAASSLAMRGLD